MAELIPGFTTEQKVITVVNDDIFMNAEITTQAADGWIVTLLTLSGANMVMLFSRNIVTPVA